MASHVAKCPQHEAYRRIVQFVNAFTKHRQSPKLYSRTNIAYRHYSRTLDNMSLCDVAMVYVKTI